VRILVGYPAGIAPDIFTRIAAQGLSERLGQNFIVDNRPGANSNIATEMVVRALPDGYTLLTVTATNAINATLYEGHLHFRSVARPRPGRRPDALGQRHTSIAVSTGQNPC